MHSPLNRLLEAQGRINQTVDWGMNTYILCKTFGWDYFTLMEQPLPFIFDIMNAMNEETRKVKVHGK
jgi:hypothetical protein